MSLPSSALTPPSPKRRKHLWFYPAPLKIKIDFAVTWCSETFKLFQNKWNDLALSSSPLRKPLPLSFCHIKELKFRSPLFLFISNHLQCPNKSFFVWNVFRRNSCGDLYMKTFAYVFSNWLQNRPDNRSRTM